MKLKWESISTLHQNVFLVKVLAAVFITGLAFRFYAVRFGQVSVNEISDPQISPPSVIISENEDLLPIGMIIIFIYQPHYNLVAVTFVKLLCF